MKLPKLRAEIRRIEADLARLYNHATNLELTASMPPPLKQAAFDGDASLRAAQLFWSHLTPAQRSEYIRDGYFYCCGKDSRARYLISPFRAFRETSPGCGFWQHFCLVVGVAMPTPLEDQMLAKKILIEQDERLFLYTANTQSTFPLEKAVEIIRRDLSSIR